MSDYCIICGERSPQDGDDGRYIEFEDCEGLDLYTEKWICKFCYWRKNSEIPSEKTDYETN